MLTRGSTFKDYYYTYCDGGNLFWNSLKAIDFKHAAKSVYSRTSVFDRARRVRLCSSEFFDCPEYDGPVSGLKSYF